VQTVDWSGDAGAGRTPLGISVAFGAAAMVAATLAAAAMFAEVPARLAVVAVALAAFAAAVDDPLASVATGVLGFLLLNGFLVNRLGELTWNGRTSSGHVAVLTGALGLGMAWQRVRAARLAAAREDELNEILDGTSIKKEPNRG
jgi:hypothetical protein